MTEPFVLVHPPGPALPILLSSPHSGRFYPPEERHRLGISPDTLAALNDGPVHELFEPAVQEGGTMIRARWSRAWVDLNRDPAELDEEAIADVPASQRPRRSLRVQAGLGVVPTRLGERRIHRCRLHWTEISSRIAAVHLPYHTALASESARLADRFGQVLLLDCHSMPGSATGRAALPDIVLGDRYGRSCSGQLVALAEQLFRDCGFSIARNRPFAGGWITERHGRPGRHVHALQIELCRDLFFPESLGNRAVRARLRAAAGLLARQLGMFLVQGSEDGLQAAE